MKAFAKKIWVDNFSLEHLTREENFSRRPRVTRKAANKGQPGHEMFGRRNTALRVTIFGLLLDVPVERVFLHCFEGFGE